MDWCIYIKHYKYIGMFNVREYSANEWGLSLENKIKIFIQKINTHSEKITKSSFFYGFFFARS